MKKTAITLGSAVFLCLAAAMPALADSSLPQPHSGPQVLGAGGTAGGGTGGTAFTGSDMSLALIALAILVVSAALLLALRGIRTADE
jgi:hypothetical protein